METLVTPFAHPPARPSASPVTETSAATASTSRALVAVATRLPLFTTAPAAFVDITDSVQQFVHGTRVRTGTVTVQSLHTTTALVVNEAEPLLLLDFHSLLDRLVPRGSLYRHDDLANRRDIAADEPLNGHAHCRALLLPTSQTLTVIGGELMLGRWQRLFFVELDGPRRRDVVAVITGEGGR